MSDVINKYSDKDIINTDYAVANGIPLLSSDLKNEKVNKSLNDVKGLTKEAKLEAEEKLSREFK
ncbi:hypothetical protein [Clostridium sp.]|uniref:hypothetical protein n=1 Tax=Clostridium sp. TaxID=1506 RepID=UPI002FCB7632